MPLMSVLMPVRNEEQYLPAALDSLLRQTLHDWELIVVDDGSDDATPQILNQYRSKDPRIQILTQKSDGLVAALNRGLDACRAPLVARMDGDDICHPQRLQKQLCCFSAHPKLTLVACAVRHFPRMRISAGMLAYEAWQNNVHDHESILRDLYVESPFAHPSVVYRRKDILEAGGYNHKPWAEDYDLWLRLSQREARFARIPEVLLYWRDRPQRLTRTSSNCSLDAFRRCKAHYLKRSYLNGRDSVTLWGAGQEGKAWRRVLQQIGVRVDRWIDIDPRKIGQTIHGAVVHPPEDLLEKPSSTLITVGARGARIQIRAWSSAAGLREGEDFVCVT